MLDKYASECSKKGVKILILPELFITGYEAEYYKKSAIQIPIDYCVAKDNKEKPNNPILYGIGSICMKYNIDIICGIAELQVNQVNDKASQNFNTALWMTFDGTIRTKYHKTHLWGEYERKYFDPPPFYGNIIGCFGLKIGLQICYDIEFVEG
eukprot:UN12958